MILPSIFYQHTPKEAAAAAAAAAKQQYAVPSLNWTLQQLVLGSTLLQTNLSRSDRKGVRQFFKFIDRLFCFYKVLCSRARVGKNIRLVIGYRSFFKEPKSFPQRYCEHKRVKITRAHI